MKEFIDFIKKLWSNKRTKSLSILIIYFIFFFFVFILIDNSKDIPVIDREPLGEMRQKIVSRIEFIGNHNFVVTNDTIIYNDVIYSINDIPVELAIYDISIYITENIYNLIKSGVLESTNYVEGTNTYLISAQTFEKVIYNNQIDIDHDIRITLQEEFKTVYIDLRQYYGYEVRIDLRS